MTCHSKSWNEQQDELCEKINEALQRRQAAKRQRICREAHKATMLWAKSKEALETMQSITLHIQGQ